MKAPLPSFVSMPVNARLEKLTYKNPKAYIPLIQKQRFLSRNTVNVKVKDFVPFVEHDRLIDIDLPEAPSHFGMRSKSFRVRQAVFKKPEFSRAGFSASDVKLLEGISDPSAKALALATMERVFKLDNVFKDNQKDTPFKLLTPAEQDEAKMYLSELQSAMVAIQNSKMTSLEIQENTSKAINNYVQKIRNIIKTKNNQPGFTSLIDAYNNFARQVTSVSDLLIAGNETIATVADALTPDTPQQLIEKKGLAITVTSKGRGSDTLTMKLYKKIYDLLVGRKDYKDYWDEKRYPKGIKIIDPYIQSLRTTASGKDALDKISAIILLDPSKTVSVAVDEYIGMPGHDFVNDFITSAVGALGIAPIIAPVIAPVIAPGGGGGAVDTYEDIKDIASMRKHLSDVVVQVGNDKKLAISDMKQYEQEAIDAYRSNFFGNPVDEVKASTAYKPILEKIADDILSGAISSGGVPGGSGGSGGSGGTPTPTAPTAQDLKDARDQKYQNKYFVLADVNDLKKLPKKSFEVFLRYIDRFDSKNTTTRVDPSLGTAFEDNKMLNPAVKEADGRQRLWGSKTLLDPTRIGNARSFLIDTSEGKKYHRILKQIMDEQSISLGKAMEVYVADSANPNNPDITKTGGENYPLGGWGRKKPKTRGKPKVTKKTVSKNKLIEIANILKMYS